MIEVSLYSYRELGMFEGRLDINQAPAEKLAELPVLGDFLAERIVEHIKREGAITDLEYLIKIQGISKIGQ